MLLNTTLNDSTIPGSAFDSTGSTMINDTSGLNDATNGTSGPPGSGPATGGLNLFALITISLQIATAIVVIVGNGLVLAAIAMFRNLRDITGIFVANLAVADLIIGVTLPFQIAFFYVPELETNKYTCLLRYEVVAFACNASILSLTCTVIDRYIAIAYPLNYYQMMTDKIAYVVVGIIWLLDVVFAFIPTFGANTWDSMPFTICLYELVVDPYYKLLNCFFGLFFACFILTLYIRIYFIARRHMRQIQAEAFQQSGDRTTAVSKQMHRVMAIVVLLFHVSWLPFYVMQLTMLFPEDVTKDKVIVANFLVFLGIMNSTINPVIYAWKNKAYRRAFKKLLGLKHDDDAVTTLSTTNRD